MKKPPSTSAVRVAIVFVTALVVLTAGLVLTSVGHSRKSLAQDSEKLLEIERYPNELLELVELKVSDKSLKRDIKFKFKDNVSKWGRDHVKFKQQDGWFKHVKVRLRNISGLPIHGIKASLHFEPLGVKMLFGLLMVWTKDLKREPLQPGEEIDLEVNEQSLERTLERMRECGVDANLSSVSFSLDDAYFSEDLKWSRGTLLQRDPNDRYRWSPVNKAAPLGRSLDNHILPEATPSAATCSQLGVAAVRIRQ